MVRPATTSACPRCKAPVTWNEEFPNRPFCSERCKLLDLGAWLTEEHRLPADEATPDLSAPDSGGTDA